MNIISCDVLKAYRFYTGVDSIQINPSYPESVKFMAISRYNHMCDYMSGSRVYTYLPSSLFKIKEYIGYTKQKIRDNEHRLSNWEME